MRLNDLFENDSLKDYFKQLQKTDPRFRNIRVHGDPEHDELRRQDLARSQARRQQAASVPVDVAELKKQLAAAQAKYQQLGGDSYQYADRMMPQDYEAQQVHQQIQSLARRIQAAGG